MNKFLEQVWKILRYWKPVRTFWITAASLMGTMMTGSQTASLTDIKWEFLLSTSLVAAIFNFVVLMSTGDSFWSESKQVSVTPVEDSQVSTDVDEDTPVEEVSGFLDSKKKPVNDLKKVVEKKD